MNTIKVDLGSDKKYVNLYPVGDVHAGSAHYMKKEFNQIIEQVVYDPNAVVILNGDLFNNAIKTSVSDIYDEKLTPQDTLDYLVEISTK